MELSEDLRLQLWRSSDWTAVLSQLQTELLDIADPWQRSARAFELGLVCEQVLADREWAIQLYERSWKATGDHRRALIRARFLCRELLRLDLAARLMEIEERHFSDSPLLVQAGMCWLDAGEANRAAATLARAAAARPGDRTVEAACHMLDTPTGKATREANKLVEQGSRAEAADPHAAAQLYLAAARLLRARGSEAQAAGVPKLLRRAASLDPRDDGAALLLEMQLVRERAWKELVALAERRTAVAKTDYERIDHLRRGGIALARRHDEPALGATLLERALALGYDQKLANIPCHLAMITVLRGALMTLGQPARFLEFVDRALAAEISDDERVFLALQGVQVATESGDKQAAKRHAATLAKLEPQHPLLAPAAKLVPVPVAVSATVPVPAKKAAAPPPTPVSAKKLPPPTPAPIPIPTATPIPTPAPVPPPGPDISRRQVERSEFHEAVVVAVSAQVMVKLPAGGPAGSFHATSRDISRGGVYVVTDRQITADEVLQLTLLIPGVEDWSLDMYPARVRVVRVEAGRGFGGAFVDPPSDLLAAIDRLVKDRSARL